MTGITLDRHLYRTGTLIAGRYEVLSKLGSGGIGVVLRVSDRELRGKELALKLLHPHLLGNERLAARLRNEVLLMRDLTHPNIVRLFEFGDAGEQRFFITMEYVRGQTLRQLLKGIHPERLAFQETLRILEQIVAGVAHAHDRGILHRDLKPDNILLTEHGEVKIADFGLARRLEDQQDLTRTGETVGTVYYMAPEQIRAETLDARADVYSLGIIAYEMALGCRPFEDESYFTVLHRQLTEELPDLSRQDSRIPPWFRDLVHRATAKDRRERFPNAGTLAKELQRRAVESSARTRSIIQLSFRQRRTIRKLLTRSSVIIPLVFAAICILSRMNNRIMYFVSTPILRIERITGLNLAAIRYLAGSRLTLRDEDLIDLVTGPDMRALDAVLASGKEPNVVDESGDPALLVAALFSWESLPTEGKPIELLLEAGADPNVRDTDLNRTPLMLAILRRNDIGALALIAAGAEVDAIDDLGRTALAYATNVGMPGVVYALLEAGADLNQADADGWTPLMNAITRGNVDLVRELLRRGASPTAPAVDGMTPLRLAAYFELTRDPDSLRGLRGMCDELPELDALRTVARLSVPYIGADISGPWSVAEAELYLNLPSPELVFECAVGQPVARLLMQRWTPLVAALRQFGAPAEGLAADPELVLDQLARDELRRALEHPVPAPDGPPRSRSMKLRF